MGNYIYRIILVILSMSILFLSSCMANKKTFEHYSISNPMQLIGVTEQGIVQVIDRLIWFYDFATGEKIIFCNLPNCQHEPFHYSSNPDPTCLAALPSGDVIQTLGLYDNDLFIFASENVNETIVYRVDFENSSREVFTSFDWSLFSYGNISFIDDYVYFIANKTQFDEHGASTNDVEFTVLGLNLKTGKVSQHGKVKNDNYAGIYRLKKIGNKLYYRYEYIDVEGEFDFFADDAQEKRAEYSRWYFYEIDLESNEERIVLDLRENSDYKYLYHYDEDKLYFLSDDQTEFYAVNWDLSEKDVLFSGEEIDISTSLDDGFIYTQNNLFDERYYYDTGTKKIKKIKRPELELPIEIEYKDLFLFNALLEDGEYHLVALNRDDYFAGKTDYIIFD